MSLSFIGGSNDTIPRSVATSESLKVSVVIPAFNEGARIRDSIFKITDYLKTAPFEAEVLVVDDGSTDKTVELVEQIKFPGLRLVRNETNRGKGYCVRKGVLASIGVYVLFTDADLS